MKRAAEARAPHASADEARTASAKRISRSHVPPLRDTHRGGARDGDPAAAEHVLMSLQAGAVWHHEAAMPGLPAPDGSGPR